MVLQILASLGITYERLETVPMKCQTPLSSCPRPAFLYLYHSITGEKLPLCSVHAEQYLEGPYQELPPPKPVDNPPLSL